MIAARKSEDARRHLLVIDDDRRLRDLLREFLTRRGYRVSVAADAAAARHLLGGLRFDLIVVDVVMPGESGLALTQWLRGRSTTISRAPVLILTARGDPDDRIEGLRVGADDYLAKPFEPEELVLRIDAILRRTMEQGTEARHVKLGSFVFDTARGDLRLDGSPVRLTESESQVLRVLAAAANSPVHRQDLAEGGSEASDRAIDIHITRLRRKVEADPGNPQYIRTVRGRGYMLTPD